MKVIVPGHVYHLDIYDIPKQAMAPVVWLGFMRRIGPGYPGNVDASSGTNCQEVLRVLIDRVKYLDNQQHSVYNLAILDKLRSALLMFELRAKEMKRQKLPRLDVDKIETYPACEVCGHIFCREHKHGK
jgi:hypothetical protein